jgi:hypothetical protein
LVTLISIERLLLYFLALAMVVVCFVHFLLLAASNTSVGLTMTTFNLALCTPARGVTSDVIVEFTSSTRPIGNVTSITVYQLVLHQHSFSPEFGSG